MRTQKEKIRRSAPGLRTKFEKSGVYLVAALTWLMGALNLFTAIHPGISDRIRLIESMVPFEVQVGSRLTIAFIGFALFLLAISLWRQKRVGRILTIALLLISAIAHLVKGLNYEEAGISLLLVFILVLLRRSYYRDSDHPSVVQGLIVLLAAVIFTILYGTIGFALAGRHINNPIGFMAALKKTLSLLVLVYDMSAESGTGFEHYFIESVYLVGFATIGFALYMLIRPVLIRQPSTEAERLKAAGIVKEFGKSTSSFLALFDDKHLFFSEGGSVIAYAVLGRGALVLGDPIGPKKDTAAAVEAFKAFCSKNDWQPSFLYVLPENLEIYKKNDFKCLCVAYEAIIPLANFTLEGSENKSLRNPVSKLERMGYQARVYNPPLDKELIDQLRVVSDAWLSSQAGGEKHFIVGYFSDEYVSTTPIIAIHAPTGEITAFANIISIPKVNEITIDLMRHQHRLENGTMEFLFTSLSQWGKENGFDSFSLGATTIFGMQNVEDNSAATRMLFFIASLVNRFYRFQGLYQFKNKFHPDWVPRYVAYPGALALPLAVTTLVRVHSGKNFLWWYLRK
jgi:phosphatidylglycerol lysyltransferase